MRHRRSSVNEVLSKRGRTILYNNFITIRVSDEEKSTIEKIVNLKGYLNKSHFVMSAVHELIRKLS